jgi:hypothetical protein
MRSAPRATPWRGTGPRAAPQSRQRVGLRRPSWSRLAQRSGFVAARFAGLPEKATGLARFWPCAQRGLFCRQLIAVRPRFCLESLPRAHFRQHEQPTVAPFQAQQATSVWADCASPPAGSPHLLQRRDSPAWRSIWAWCFNTFRSAGPRVRIRGRSPRCLPDGVIA